MEVSWKAEQGVALSAASGGLTLLEGSKERVGRPVRTAGYHPQCPIPAVPSWSPPTCTCSALAWLRELWLTPEGPTSAPVLPQAPPASGHLQVLPGAMASLLPSQPWIGPTWASLLCSQPVALSRLEMPSLTHHPSRGQGRAGGLQLLDALEALVGEDGERWRGQSWCLGCRSLVPDVLSSLLPL